MKKLVVLFIIIISSCSSEKDAAVDNTPKLLPTVKTLELYSVGKTSVQGNGEVVSDGGKPLTAFGVCWSSTGNPNINGDHLNVASQGWDPSYFSYEVTTLQEHTNYNIRTYATNDDGTSYGNMLTFKTYSSTPINFTTKEITDIAATSASTTLADLTDVIPGDYSTGICYGTTINPTITSNLVTPFYGRYILKKLLPNTKYYVRAYYTNISTNITNYGQNQVFTTLLPGTSPQGENAICDGIQITTVVPVTSITGRVWMDRNLGASRALVAADWTGSFGGFYQWGRGNDGHASINPTTTNITSNTDTPGHDMVINGTGIPSTNPQYNIPFSTDWRVPKNDNLWQGVNGVNNPCPLGYRLPSTEEFQIEFAAYNITDQASAMNSPLKLLFSSGIAYWTSSARLLPEGYGSYFVTQYGDYPIRIDLGNRASMACIRCIKD